MFSKARSILIGFESFFLGKRSELQLVSFELCFELFSYMRAFLDGTILISVYDSFMKNDYGYT